MTSRAKELIGYSFLVVFANDHDIDEDELALLERLALEDDVVDDEERRALRAIFDRIDAEETARKVVQEIERFRAQYGI